MNSEASLMLFFPLIKKASSSLNLTILLSLIKSIQHFINSSLLFPNKLSL